MPQVPSRRHGYGCPSAPTGSSTAICWGSPRARSTGCAPMGHGIRREAIASIRPGCCSTPMPARSRAAFAGPAPTSSTRPRLSPSTLLRFGTFRAQGRGSADATAGVGREPAPAALGPHAPLRDARQGNFPAAPGRAGGRGAAPRGARPPASDRARAAARHHRDRAPARSGLPRRAPARPAGPQRTIGATTPMPSWCPKGATPWPSPWPSSRL